MLINVTVIVYYNLHISKNSCTFAANFESMLLNTSFIMKKQLFVCLVGLLAFAGHSNATVYSGSCGTNLTWTLDSEDGILVVTGSGEMIGSTYCLSPVNELVKHVQLPEGLTALGMGALGNCRNLEDISIPSGVTAIGERAFFFCDKLEAIPIPSGVTSIGKGAFQDCTHLKEMLLPDGLKTLEQGAFYGCARMKNVNIPSGIQTIAANTFQDCKALTSIQLPASVTSIGEQAFAGDKAIKEIQILSGTPPLIAANTFEEVPDTAWLSVIPGTEKLFKNDANWSRFRIKNLPEQLYQQTTVTVQAEQTTALFTWPNDPKADSYQIDIYKDGTVFCKLTLGPKGQLLAIAFSAPERQSNYQQPTTNDQRLTTNDQLPTTNYQLPTTNTLSFMVTGLDFASRYNYVLSTLDANGTPLHVYIGDFATIGYTGELKGGGNEVIPTPPIIPGDPEAKTPTGFNQISQEPIANSQKLIKDNQILILRGNNTYTIQGQLVQ